MSGIPFDFEVEAHFFKSDDAAQGRQRRVGGLVSTESPDQEGEVVLQDGLDFSYFLKNGWFNDNHSQRMADVLGYPEKVQRFAKGEMLPSGKASPAKSTWVEGYLLDDPEADKIWEKGLALQKTNRRLGFSVEGKIRRRVGRNNKTIAKAVVKNAAITHCPVNDESKLEILAKSLQVMEATEPDILEKMLGRGVPAQPGAAPVGPQTGMGAGQVITGESLETDDEKKKRKKLKESLSKSEAIAWVRARLPNADHAMAQRIVETTLRLKQAKLR